MKQDAADRYQARMQRVLTYIEVHLDDDLSVEVLAGVAAFSRHHFQRQFASLLGISVHRYVQLCRLKRASYRLTLRPHDPVLRIALDAGYEGPEAFARAIGQRFDQTPSVFREEPRWRQWHALCEPLNRTRTLDDALSIAIGFMITNS